MGSSSTEDVLSMESCIDPWEFAYVVGIVIQVLFIGIYAGIYFWCFNKNDSVTKMHMFVFYINSSFWGWAICLCFYNFLFCGGSTYTNIFVTACVFVGVFGVSSCIEMCCSREGGYFRHQKSMKECIQYMNSMKETAPVHRVEIECYHYETERRRDGKEDRRKITTYREGRDFLYDRWIDDSDYPNLPEISLQYPVVAVDSSTAVTPGDDFTQMQFDNFRRNFVEQNRHRDWYIDETERTLVLGHKSTVTAKSEKENEVPWWLHCGFFYFLALIFCSCPLRVLFRSKSKRHDFVIRKVYYIEPDGSNIGNMGVNVTINVVNNKGVVNVGTNPEGIPMLQQGPNTGQMDHVEPSGQQNPPPGQKHPPPGQQHPPPGQQYPPSQQEYPAAQKYPSRPARAQKNPPAYATMEEKPPQYGYPAAQKYASPLRQQNPPPFATMEEKPPQYGYHAAQKYPSPLRQQNPPPYPTMEEKPPRQELSSPGQQNPPPQATMEEKPPRQELSSPGQQNPPPQATMEEKPPRQELSSPGQQNPPPQATMEEKPPRQELSSPGQQNPPPHATMDEKPPQHKPSSPGQQHPPPHATMEEKPPSKK